MDKALLDTDILSEIIKGKNARVMESADRYCAIHARLCTSTVSIVEVVKGLYKLPAKDRLNRFLGIIPSYEVVALDTAAAIFAGQIYAELELAGQSIGRADPMIAAITIQHGVTLVTGNTEHFARIQALGYALKLDDWRN